MESPFLRYLFGIPATETQASGLLGAGQKVAASLYPEGWRGGLLGLGNPVAAWAATQYGRAMPAYGEILKRTGDSDKAAAAYVRTYAGNPWENPFTSMAGPAVMGTVGKAARGIADLVGDDLARTVAPGKTFIPPQNLASFLERKLKPLLQERGYQVNATYANTGSGYVTVRGGRLGPKQEVHIRLSTHAPGAARGDHAREFVKSQVSEYTGNTVRTVDIDTGSGVEAMRRQMRDLERLLDEE